MAPNAGPPNLLIYVRGGWERVTDCAHLEGNRQNTRCRPTFQCQEPNCSDWPEGNLIKGDEVTPVGSGVMVASSGSGPKPLTMPQVGDSAQDVKWGTVPEMSSGRRDPDVKWGAVPRMSSGGRCPRCQVGDSARNVKRGTSVRRQTQRIYLPKGTSMAHWWNRTAK